MTRDINLTHLLTDWLEDQPDRAPGRLLDVVLTDLQSAPQGARWKLALRRIPMFTSNGARYLAVGAVGVLAVVIGLGLWANGNSGVGGAPSPSPSSAAGSPQPTVAPSPSPALLATGTFKVVGVADVELDALGEGDGVTGSMKVSRPSSGVFTVDLGCARTTEAGLLWIAGDVVESTDTDAKKGTRAGIILKRGSPAEGIFVFQFDDPPSASCSAFIADMASIADPLQLMPIEGSVVFGP